MAAVLIVEDDPASARCIERMLPRQLVVRRATTRDEATRIALAHDDWAGFLVDVGLRDDDHGGLAFLDAARDAVRGRPQAIVSGSADPFVVSRAAALGAVFVAKPFGRDELAKFLEGVMQSAGEATEIDRLAIAWGLSPRERDLCVHLAGGGTRVAYRAERGVSAETVRTQVRSILAKAGATKMSDVIARVRRAAPQGADACASPSRTPRRD